MANPIIKIKRGSVAPVATLQAGEFAIDQVAKNLYLGVEVEGVVTNEIVGGEGTFATKSYVDTAVSTATGSLGTMSTQDADSVAITGGTLGSGANPLFISSAEISSSPIDNSAIGANIASTGAFTTLTASSAPSASTDVVRKTDLDSAISALGSVFHYVGDLSTNIVGTSLATLTDGTTGAYYKVDVAGAYTDGATTFNAKVGDAFVKTSTGWQKLDNVDAVVSGTANEIAVTGDENAGYTVALDAVFSGRMTTAESDIDALEGRATTAESDITDLETKTQNIDLATTAGTTKLTGTLETVGIVAGQNIFNITAPVLVEIDSPEFLVLGALSADEKLTVLAGGFEVTGNSTLTGDLSVTGNLVGDGTNQITDFIIDGGVY
jgi:hypothetical protein